MQAAASLRLKPGKERPLLQRHHWIYSGAIAQLPSGLNPGDLVEVFSARGDRLGLALLNPGHSIAAHMIAHGDEELASAIRRKLLESKRMRDNWFDPSRTNAIRLINAEGDGIPGLIIDSYAGVLVMQISHPGIERMKETLLSLLIETFQPRAIFEKSTSFLRKKGGMDELRAHLYGEPSAEVEVVENGLRFAVNLLEGQKTGLFLDQREMRSLVRELAPRKKILNCFAYTGGFSIAALAGGAAHVDSVEISAKCAERAEKNLQLNQLANHRFITADVFEFFKTCSWDYDLVILDPPAFVKKRADVANAFRAYKEMNRHAISKMKPNTILLSCSCSYHVEETLFQNILFRAAAEAGRTVRVIGRHRNAIDHPISIFHPESAYIKSFIMHIQ